MDPWESDALRDIAEADRRDRDEYLASRSRDDAEKRMAERLVEITGHWSVSDISRADALKATGENQRANRIQVWTFDQAEKWVNLMGDEKLLADMNESYLLNVVAFLHSNASRFARLWAMDHLLQSDPESDWARVRPDYERVQLAYHEPHRFMAQCRLMTGLWAEVFKRRGRMNGFEDSGEDS